MDHNKHSSVGVSSRDEDPHVLEENREFDDEHGGAVDDLDDVGVLFCLLAKLVRGRKSYVKEFKHVFDSSIPLMLPTDANCIAPRHQKPNQHCLSSLVFRLSSNKGFLVPRLE